MIHPLTRYFLKSLFTRRTRQGPLILAGVGLFLASFSLIFLQSTMGGLQHKLMDRSKRVTGNYIISFPNLPLEDLSGPLDYLDQQKINYIIENQIEGLIRFKDTVLPVIVHGIDRAPPFFDVDVTELMMPYDLSYKLKVSFADRVEIIFPGLVDSFLEDIPRSSVFTIQELFATDVPEVDELHVWTKMSRIQNILKQKTINKIILYQKLNNNQLENLKKILPISATLKSWDALHPTLVYALKLEAFMMVFLFAIMSLLVALSVISGLLILWHKLKYDMISFWILGASRGKLMETPRIVILLMACVPTILGLVFGLFALSLLRNYGGELMPAVFVDRVIPVRITFTGILTSLFIPSSLALMFGLMALKSFQKEQNFVELIRGAGNR